jgi:chemotaxis methyl-accepting protein methylase
MVNMAMRIDDEINRLAAQIFQIDFSRAVIQQAIDVVFDQQAVAVGVFKTLKIDYCNVFI